LEEYASGKRQGSDRQGCVANFHLGSSPFGKESALKLRPLFHINPKQGHLMVNNYKEKFT
jgi:hypothetical protein